MSNWGVKRKIVLDVKFPDWISMFEDTCFWEKARGYKMDVCDVYVYHHHRSTLKAYLQQNIRNGIAETQYRRHKKDKKWIYSYIIVFVGIITLFCISIISQYYILTIFFFVLYIVFLIHRRYGIFKMIYKQHGLRVLAGSIILHNISVIATTYGIIKEIIRGN
jgi:hypothetical protein